MKRGFCCIIIQMFFLVNYSFPDCNLSHVAKWNSTAVSYNPATQIAYWPTIDAAASVWNNSGYINYFNSSGSYSLEEDDLGFIADDGTVTLGETTVSYKSGIISNALTYITNNISVIWVLYTSSSVPSNEYDLETCVIHEMGHALGFCLPVNGVDTHSTDPTSIMYATQASGTMKRYLTQDVLDCLLAIYGGITPVCSDCPIQPGAPTGLSITIVGQNVVLNWNTYNDYYATYFNVYRNGKIKYSWNMISGSPSSNTYTDVNGVASFPALYQISAGNGAGESFSQPPIQAITSPSTISSYTNWGGEVVYINSNVTVLSGKELDMGSNTKVIFNAGHGYSLTMNGILYAQGISGKPVVFTSNASSPSIGSWGSIVLSGSGASGSNLNYITMQYGTDIQFLNGANGTLQNSIVKNCTRGVYVYNSNANISSNSFQDNLNEAIYCNGSGYTHQININTITKTSSNPQYHQQWAIDVSGTSYGYISKNDISGFIYGMWIGGGATAYFLKENQNQPYTYPNNRIRDCYYAVTAAWGGSVRNDTYYYMWYSSIYNNVFYDLYAYQSGTIYSICDYYSGGNPKSYKDGTSTINISNPLSYNPWGTTLNSQLLDNSTTENHILSTNVSSSIIQSGTENGNDVDDGITFEQQKNYTGAIAYYQSLLKSGKVSQKTLAALAHFGAEAGNKDVTNYYETLKTTKNEYQPFVMELLAGLYTHQGDNQKSVAIYDEIIKAFPNTYHEKLAWFQKFYYALHVENNKSKALDLLNTIKSKYSNDDAEGNIERAESILSSAGELEKKGAEERLDGQLGQSEKQLESLTTFQLLQNYPNPFNPTTMISYQLPNDAKVTLKVFDILGREVATLVEGEVGAGIHTATFDGSRYSSGMYFVRLVVRAQGGGTFTKTIKMLMLK